MGQRITKLLGLIALTGSFSLLEAQSTFTWNPAGPIYTAGRARNMVVDKNDPSGNTLYVGSTSSGVFKTTNGGTDWFPVDDQGTIRNISYMAQGADGTIWVATGEGFLRWGQKAKAQRGTGLYKLQGSSLVQVKDSNALGAVINRVACDPNNAQRIALGTNKGIWISQDGGSNFSQLATPGLTTNLVTGMDVKFNNNGVLYCTAGSELAYLGYGQLASKVYRSDAALTALSDITPTNSSMPDFNYGRIELAIAPSNNNVIYASCAAKSTANPTTTILGSQASATLKGIFISYDGGSSWTLIRQGSSSIDPLSNGSTIASGDYAHSLMVHPTYPYLLFYGGYSFYLYLDNAGSSPGTWVKIGSNGFFNTPYYLHENIHDMRMVGNNPARLYFITDAGIFRSTDFGSANQIGGASFQPFYKGLVTGQFNSVSIDRFPTGTNTGTMSVSGQSVNPNSGFIGGTGGNGLTYYSGTSSLVTQETSYLGGEVYNAEYSKILYGAAFMSTGQGSLYRTTNAKTSNPQLVNINKYTGSITKVAPTAEDFANTGFSTGTPFKLWENYGQIANTPDSAVFYNDTVPRLLYGVSGVSTLVAQTNFTFSASRPPGFPALIDSIVIRTGTVSLPLSTSKSVSPVPFTGSDLQDITIKLSNNYVLNTNTITIPPVIKVTGPASTSGLTAPGVTINPSLQSDIISVTFTAPPFATKTQTYSDVPDAAGYYRVFATVFYRYKAGDTVSVVDNNISTRTTTYTTKLTRDLRWTLTYTSTSNNPSGPKTAISSPAVVNPATNPRVKIATTASARLAMILNNGDITNNANNPYAIVVSKAPLSLNDPLNFVRVSQSGCYSDNSSGAPTTNSIVITGKPTLLEWSKGGTEIYYATEDPATSTYNLYRVSHIVDIMDLSQASYSGKFYTDVFAYGSSGISSGVINPNSPYRTTLIGTFTKPVSSISVSKDDYNMVVTLKGGTTSGPVVMYNTNSIKVSDASNINWVQKADATGKFTGLYTYCSLIEKDDSKKVFVGTDNGLYYTSDITAGSPTWVNINEISNTGGKLPNVQIFDIKQQTIEGWNCYNSGQIYIATNGRGIWSTSNFLRGYYTEVNNLSNGNDPERSLNLFPNPANSSVNVKFNGVDGENATVQVFDISGRMVKTEDLGRLGYGEVTHSVDLSNLNGGIYMVNVQSTSGMKRVAKLILTK